MSCLLIKNLFWENRSAIPEGDCWVTLTVLWVVQAGTVCMEILVIHCGWWLENVCYLPKLPECLAIPWAMRTEPWPGVCIDSCGPFPTEIQVPCYGKHIQNITVGFYPPWKQLLPLSVLPTEGGMWLLLTSCSNGRSALLADGFKDLTKAASF